MKMMPGKMYDFALVSGGFDPLHVGHIHLINDAFTRGNKVIVLLNSDDWLAKKKNHHVMKAVDRKLILENMKTVGYVRIQTIDHIDMSSSAAISDVVSILRECANSHYTFCFCNGGDRKDEASIREAGICKQLGIDMLFDVGGPKIDSSQDIIRRAREAV